MIFNSINNTKIKMKKHSILLAILLISQFLFGQKDSIKNGEASRHGNLTAYLYELRQIQGENNIKHEYSFLDYKVNIPIWWKIRETPNNFMFGGTFPAINGVENALLFKSFLKTEFKDLINFENWVIKDYKIGDIPKWSNKHTILLKKENKDLKKLGKSYVVNLLRNGKIYQCQYIIIETPKTYLWIDFTSTKDTYDINLDKLKQIIKSFEIIN